MTCEVCCSHIAQPRTLRRHLHYCSEHVHKSLCRVEPTGRVCCLSLEVHLMFNVQDAGAQVGTALPVHVWQSNFPARKCEVAMVSVSVDFCLSLKRRAKLRTFLLTNAA